MKTPAPFAPGRARVLRRLAPVAAIAVLAVLSPARAQERFPERPIRMLVGFAPGGPTDVVGRAFAARLSGILGQTVVVQNKPGAATTIATAEIAQAKPDGYTILFTGSAALTITPLSIPGLAYDVRKDLAPIAQVAAERFAIAVNPSVPAKNLKELAGLAKAKPGEYKFASSGTGNIGHLTGELFALQAGKVDMPHVPYKGAAPAMQDVLAGHVQVLAAGVGSMYQQHQAGKLRVIAITDELRSTVATEIPTSGESGFPGLIAKSVFVVLAPAGTPAPIVDALNAAFSQALKDEALIRDLQLATVEPILSSTPASTRAFIDGELRKWADLVKSNGIKLN